MTRVGLIFAIFGIIYIIKPDIYRRWFWKKADVMQQRLSRENYIRYMRIFGVAIILIGLAMMFIGKFKF